MVIISKKELDKLNASIEGMSVALDMERKKVAELEKRVALLELTPQKKIQPGQVFDEWINGERTKA